MHYRTNRMIPKEGVLSTRMWLNSVSDNHLGQLFDLNYGVLSFGGKQSGWICLKSIMAEWMGV
jgi:hypothetical protein